MALPWRTVYTPHGVQDAARTLPFGALIVLLLLSPAVYAPEGLSTARMWLAAAVGAFVLFRAARQVNAHVSTGPSGLEIAGLYRTVRLPWEQVALIRVQAEVLDDDEREALDRAAPHDRLMKDEWGEAYWLAGIAVTTTSGRDVRLRRELESVQTLDLLVQALRLANEDDARRRRRAR